MTKQSTDFSGNNFLWCFLTYVFVLQHQCDSFRSQRLRRRCQCTIANFRGEVRIHSDSISGGFTFVVNRCYWRRILFLFRKFFCFASAYPTNSYFVDGGFDLCFEEPKKFTFLFSNCRWFTFPQSHNWDFGWQFLTSTCVTLVTL